MPNKLALLLTIILVMVDVYLLVDYAYRPVQDSNDGMLQEGLMDMFAMGVAGLLILYFLIFLLLYLKKKFSMAKKFCWALLAFQIAFITQMIFGWLISL